MSEGIFLLSEGAAALSESTRRDDVRAMEQAGATIGQGLSRLKNGLAARRALESTCERTPTTALLKTNPERYDAYTAWLSFARHYSR